MFEENKFEKSTEVGVLGEKQEIVSDVSKIETKIENLKDLKYKIEEMYEGRKITAEVQEFLLELDEKIKNLPKQINNNN